MQLPFACSKNIWCLLVIHPVTLEEEKVRLVTKWVVIEVDCVRLYYSNNSPAPVTVNLHIRSVMVYCHSAWWDSWFDYAPPMAFLCFFRTVKSKTWALQEARTVQGEAREQVVTLCCLGVYYWPGSSGQIDYFIVLPWTSVARDLWLTLARTEHRTDPHLS